jgi:DNA-binding CsgD family transcriptional regulator
MQLVPSGHLMMRRIHRVSEARAQVAHAPLAGTELTRVIAARLELLATRGGLSARERDVLSQLAIGRSLEQIASSLAISHRTVRFHQGNVLTKLGLSSRHELLLLLLDDS